MTPTYRYRATCVRVVDGDTYELLIDLGCHVHTRVPVRLRGYSAPERFTPEGIQATVAARHLLTDAALVIETWKVRGKDAQSFARYVADMWINGTHVGESMARLGHATVTTREG